MITPDVLYQCCKDFYTPENMVLSICGKVKVEEVIGIVDRVIGCERIPFEINLKGFDEPKKVKCTYKEKRMHIGKPIFCIGIKDCDIPVDPIERYKKSEGMNILLHMMFSEAGEFYLDMLEKGMVSPGFDSGYSAGAKTAYVMISGESDCPEDLLERIKEHISTCREKGLSREDFERERKCLYSSFISDFDSTEDIAFAMTSYAFDGVDLFGYPEIVRGISFEYITELLEKTFADNRFTLSVIKPLNEK
jgi:predicted Zn-dependent peptidase